MIEQSKLLAAAEKVVLLYKDVVMNVTGDQLAAAQALIKMTIAINELAVEVNKGKELLEQLSKMKAEFEGQLASVLPKPSEVVPQANSEEKTGFQSLPPRPAIDPEKLAQDILAQFLTPKK